MTLIFVRVCQGVMDLIRTVSITPDDFDHITENGKHLGANGEFNQKQFQDMMKVRCCFATFLPSRNLAPSYLDVFTSVCASVADHILHDCFSRVSYCTSETLQICPSSGAVFMFIIEFDFCAQGEIWRYSRRQINNVLEISGDEQFRSTILMLKLMEASTQNDMQKLQKSNDFIKADIDSVKDNIQDLQKSVKADIQALLDLMHRQTGYQAETLGRSNLKPLLPQPPHPNRNPGTHQTSVGERGGLREDREPLPGQLLPGGK